MFTPIRGFVFDVDGVLTDGTVLALASGEQVRAFHIHDGLAIRHAIERNYRVAIISGRLEEGVRRRLYSLDITDENLFLGVPDKVAVLTTWAAKAGLTLAELAYMGDDLPDLAAMRRCGLAACPADAVPDIRGRCHWVSQHGGGRGAVRELIETVLKAHGQWLPLDEAEAEQAANAVPAG
ncbi:MAG: 3-deoxy-D-manno-octulosonate 8-phosphate phosphatase [Hymenobacteraceae bacterium]|nr:3-deoxy-D-manno-octulosonate 8-phosphate phosphatase [Hymenobacteraceae bacterium]